MVITKISDLTEIRKNLKKEGKNICFGDKCYNEGNGTVQSRNNFYGKRASCNDCYDIVNRRIELKKIGKNICYGALCKGIIHDIDKFFEYQNYCKDCYNHGKRIRSNNIKEKNGIPHRIARNNYKRENCCVDCGENDIRVLEFDHCDGEKTADVCKITNIKKMNEEILKTQILCIICHRHKTHGHIINRSDIPVITIPYTEDDDMDECDDSKRCNGPLCLGKYRHRSLFRKINKGKSIFCRCKKCEGYYQRTRIIMNKKYIIKRKIEIGSCKHCDLKVTDKNYYLFDFDHLRDKLRCVSQMITNSCIKKIEAEIQKCQLLCCKCHKIKTAEQFNYVYVHNK